MKLLKYVVLTVILSAMSVVNANAHELSAFSGEQQDCFAKAMIGMDSVINSRLGVPPEHALDLTVLQTGQQNTAELTFDNHTLNIILAAYLWKDSPHGYAVKVFYNCAQEHAYNKQAKAD